MNNSKLTVQAEINSSIEKVWDAWTNPEHITQWNQASEDWCCPRAENDVKIGGKYNARMEAKDGSFGFDFEAVYDEVEPHKKLSYNMPDERNATTFFKSEGENQNQHNF